MRRQVCRGLVIAAAVAACLGACASASLAGGYQVAATWSQPGGASGEAAMPKGIAIGADGTVFVADYANHTIVAFDASGSVVAQWGGLGSGRGRLDHPSRMAVGPDGSVYVTDAENQRIQRFSPDGAVLDVWGRRGRGPGEFRHPRGIAVAADGTVYVTDQGNARVEVFTADGRFLRAWGSPGTGRGRFAAPKDVAVAADGRVYVVDRVNATVQAFTARGRWLGLWGGHGTEPGRLAGPRGIAVDARGHVFVADTENDRVQEFTRKGGFVRQWGCLGSLPGLFRKPRDLAQAPDRSLVVADTQNLRLERFVLNDAADDDPPRTSLDRRSGWYRAPVIASLQAGDAGSALAVTYVSIGRGDFAPASGPVAFTTQGAHRVRFLSVDGVGNQERVRRRILRLDWTRPSVLPRRPGRLRAAAGRLAELRFTVADSLSPSCLVKLTMLRDGSVVWTRGLGWRHVTRSGSALRVTLRVPAARGRYVARVTARDRAGNVGRQERSLLAY